MRTVRIPLHSRKHPGLFALVDKQHADLVNQYRWYPHWSGYTFYAYRTSRKSGKHRTISMHRELLGVSDSSMHVDHRNGDGLDNRMANIRVCTNAQNHYNMAGVPNTSSKYCGVTWHRQCGKWQAYIKKDGKNIYLGLFVREEDAAIAYNEAAKLYHGEFARLNEVQA